jgi:tryptophan synthase alpha chain
VAQAASGFINAVARLGVTGARNDAPPEIAELVARIRSHTNTPICAGFGFSSAAQISATCQATGVDGIVVASALLDRNESTVGDTAVKVAAAGSFARELKSGTV